MSQFDDDVGVHLSLHVAVPYVIERLLKNMGEAFPAEAPRHPVGELLHRRGEGLPGIRRFPFLEIVFHALSKTTYGLAII